jgi:hypothetical protein
LEKQKMEKLYSLFPDYARDIKLNIQNVLKAGRPDAATDLGYCRCLRARGTEFPADGSHLVGSEGAYSLPKR